LSKFPRHPELERARTQEAVKLMDIVDLTYGRFQVTEDETIAASEIEAKTDLLFLLCSVGVL